MQIKSMPPLPSPISFSQLLIRPSPNDWCQGKAVGPIEGLELKKYLCDKKAYLSCLCWSVAFLLISAGHVLSGCSVFSCVSFANGPSWWGRPLVFGFIPWSSEFGKTKLKENIAKFRNHTKNNRQFNIIGKLHMLPLIIATCWRRTSRQHQVD